MNSVTWEPGEAEKAGVWHLSWDVQRGGSDRDQMLRQEAEANKQATASQDSKRNRFLEAIICGFLRAVAQLLYKRIWYTVYIYIHRVFLMGIHPYTSLHTYICNMNYVYVSSLSPSHSLDSVFFYHLLLNDSNFLQGEWRSACFARPAFQAVRHVMRPLTASGGNTVWFFFVVGLFTVLRFFLLFKSLPVIACISARRGKKEPNPKRIPKDSVIITQTEPAERNSPGRWKGSCRMQSLKMACNLCISFWGPGAICESPPHTVAERFRYL